MAVRCISALINLPWETRNNSHIHHAKLPTFISFNLSSNLSTYPFSKGCLSWSIVQRTFRASVVCMARRYAPNTHLRKKKARKRGGDSKKKQKRRRKGSSRKKEGHRVIRLVSDAGTGFVYTTKKGRDVKEKLKIRKYDPQAKRHVLFQESK